MRMPSLPSLSCGRGLQPCGDTQTTAAPGPSEELAEDTFDLTAAAPPSSFFLGPQLPYAPPPARQMRHILATGESFAAPVEQRLRCIMGQRVTAHGLQALFAGLWPSAQWSVDTPQIDGMGVRIHVNARDRRGALLYSSELSVWRWSDDALELHTLPPCISPIGQALGLSAASEMLLESLVRALCKHPDARCTLALPGSTVDTLSAHQAAKRGYLFADAFGMRSPAFQSDEPDPKAAFTAAFNDWIDQAPSLRVAQIAASPQDRELLKAQAAMCFQPREFLSLGCPQANVLVRHSQGELREHSVGEAFFLQAALPAWCGLRFVNSMAPHGNGWVGQLRAQSQVLCGSQLRRELAAAHQSSEAWRNRVWTELGAGEPQVRASAYQTVGLYGPNQLRQVLKMRLPHRQFAALRSPRLFQEPEPTAQAALQQAVQLMDGT